MAPQTQPQFPLVATNNSVSLTTVPFCGTLYHMLTDCELMQENNLLINGNSPYDPPNPFPDVLNDINTGQRYIDAYEYLKKEPIDFPLPILEFIDASHFDVGDKLSTEMVAFTLGLWKRATRYQSNAWKSMGSIPNFKKTDHKSADEKVLDYHHILKEIKKDFRHVQQAGGLLFPMKWKNKYYMVRFIPYVLAILGDTPGQNATCGKMKSPSAKRLCRYCNIVKSQLSNPWKTSNLVTKDMVRKWQAHPSDLKRFSYKQVDIAWNDLCFGGCPYSAHGNCPGEMVHTLQQGMMPTTLDGLFCCKAISAEAWKKEEKEKRALTRTKPVSREDNDEDSTDDGEEDDDDDDDEDGRNDDDLLELVADAEKEQKKREDKEQRIRSGVFGGILGSEIDYITRRIGRELQHQSDRDLPIVHFASGIITRSKMGASEQQGVCLLVLFLLCSTYAVSEGKIKNKLGDIRLGGYITLIEGMITLEELMKSTRTIGFKREDLPAIKFYVQVLLDKMKKVVNRQVGDGHDTIKFHLLIHMVSIDIEKYASPSNVSGGPGESQFKTNFKLPASTTQLRDSTFDEQIYKRCHQRMVILRCSQIAERARRLANSRLFSAPNTLAADNVFKCVPRHSGGDYDLSEEKSVSSNLYLVANVGKTKGRPHHTLVPEVLYIGREFTKRWTTFFDDGATFFDSHDNPIGRPNRKGLGSHNESFQKIIDFFIPILKRNPDMKFGIFCEYRSKNNTLYRADPEPPSYGSENDGTKPGWHDWAGLECDNPNDVLPLNILFFLRITTWEMLQAVNFGCENDNHISSLGTYAVGTVCQHPLKGFCNPEQELCPDQEMQPNSSLLAFEEKVMFSVPNRKTKKLSVVPICVERIVCPLIAIPDFQPTFEHKEKKNGHEEMGKQH
jgi:hypothetical protein